MTEMAEGRRAEDKLREEHALYESVLGALSELGEGVVIYEGARYVWANEAFALMLGYTVDEILALPSYLSLIPPEDRVTQRDRLRARFSGELSDHGEATMLHRSGRHVKLEYGARALGCGDLMRGLVIVRDVTERRQMQARMIINDRMASVGTLAAGVAHEINNPLAYVMANLDMMAEEIGALESSNPRMREVEILLNEARHGAERARKIVRGLRAFSRADEEHRTPLDVRTVLDTAVNMTHNEIRHRARLVKDYGEVAPVEADETRLAQVFINLLVNAAQAIPEGHADRNEIRVVTRMDPLGRVVVEVRDTGCGIPADAIGRIFDPFFTTKDVGQGTGLGLAICHGIVAALGGTITVESEEEKGTSLRVELPSANVEPNEVKEKPVVASRPPSTRPGHVLVIDDDPMIGKALRMVLDGEHVVTVMTDGKEALELLLGGQSFDVILCDLMMPQMTGMDIYDALSRALPQLLDRVVFLTGGAFTSGARAFLDAIPNQRVEKPFAPQNLRALVRAFVR